MLRPRDFLLGVRALLFKERRRRETDEELRAWLAASAEAHMRTGLGKEAAERAARVEMGSVESVKEAVADATWESKIDSLAQDIRYSLRMLRRSPRFTLVAVLTLGLGIGANTAIFSVIDAVLLEPLPFQHPAQLVQLWVTEKAPGNFPLTGPDYLEWQARNHTLAATSLYSWLQIVNASGTSQPEPATIRQTQANFFSVLGVEPLLGRTFATGEDRAGKNRVVVLSYGFWQRHFGGRPDIVGQRIGLDGESCLVIGIMANGFNFPTGTEIWTPLDMAPENLRRGNSHTWGAVARLKPGIDVSQARANLTLIEERLSKRDPRHEQDVQAIVVPLKEQLTQGWQRQLLLLFGAVFLVLLIACANLANLLLTRATGRTREMAVRAALGASRRRLVRQMLTESVMLSLAGAALGLVGAWWGVQALQSAQNIPVPRVNPIQIDSTVLLFTLVTAGAIGVLFGLAPAFQTSALTLHGELKSSSSPTANSARRGTLLRDGLVIADIAVSIALLIGAGLMMRTFVRMRTADVGVQPDRLLTASLSLPNAGYATASARHSFFQALVAKLQEEPGVAAVALSTEIPLEGGANGYVRVPGGASSAAGDQLVEWNYITPDYFKAFGIPLQRGRSFAPDDVKKVAAQIDQIADAPTSKQRALTRSATFVAVINQSMAETFWPNRNPIGQAFDGGPGRIVVIGIAGNVKEQDIRDAAYPEAYFPLAALTTGGATRVAVKTRMEPAGFLETLRADVHALDPGLAVFRPRTMNQVVAEGMRDTSTQTLLLGSFAGLALVLAIIGIYGMMSYLVAARTHEIGVRMALGAQARDVLRLVLGHGTRLTIAGVAIGLVGAFALTRVMGAMLFGVTATDPFTFAAVPALLVLIALATCYIPARRATRTDPMRTLRSE